MKGKVASLNYVIKLDHEVDMYNSACFHLYDRHNPSNINLKIFYINKQIFIVM